MIILCPIAGQVDPLVRESWDRYIPERREVDVSSDDRAYVRLMQEAWRWDDQLLVIEHDIVVHRYVVPQLEACSLPVCAFPYQLLGRITTGLGCTRFAERDVDLLDSLITPDTTWSTLDIVLLSALPQAHEHEPPVGHINWLHYVRWNA